MSTTTEGSSSSSEGRVAKAVPLCDNNCYHQIEHDLRTEPLVGPVLITRCFGPPSASPKDNLGPEPLCGSPGVTASTRVTSGNIGGLTMEEVR